MSCRNSTLGPFDGKVAHKVGSGIICKFGEITYLRLPTPYLEGVVGAIGGTGDDGIIGLGGLFVNSYEADFIAFEIAGVDGLNIGFGAGCEHYQCCCENQLICFHND